MLSSMVDEFVSSSDDYEVPAIMSENMVLFPHMDIALIVSGEKKLDAIDQALSERHLLAVIPTSTQNVLNEIGTLALIKKRTSSSDGTHHVWLKGLWRIQVKKLINKATYTKISFTRVNELEDSSKNLKIMQQVLGNIDEFVKLLPGISSDIINLVKNAKTPGKLADLCAYSPNFTHEEKIDLLRTLDTEKRLKKVNHLFELQLDSLRRIAKLKPIPECDTCMDLADGAFESNPTQSVEIVLAFLNHVINEHTDELLSVLVEKYGPIFMKKRSLR